MDRIGELAEAMVVWLWGDEEEMAEMVEAVKEHPALEQKALFQGA